MILYAVEYNGPNSNYEASIVTIHKTRKGAEKAMKSYQAGVKDYDEIEYRIVDINTDIDDDIIYDYEQ